MVHACNPRTLEAEKSTNYSISSQIWALQMIIREVVHRYILQRSTTLAKNAPGRHSGSMAQMIAPAWP
jgi:hypothetical protein